MEGLKMLRVGFAMCGSFCTFDKAIEAAERLAGECGALIPIMSEKAYATDTRYGAAADFTARLEEICSRTVMKTINDVEPIGPKALLDILVIAPCTGNTLAKLAHAVTDTSVTMAAKAHLRNGRPLLLAVSTNDGLSGSAANIGTLLNRKNVYFVPFYQDDPQNKPNSLVTRLDLLEEAVAAAMEGRQLQPLLAREG